ncbi:MAG: hypothetical protein RMY28_009460 [Nostoc sp. ChiSLP01]|nr:hypothetical protein [Nostoc sp. CmiSLP01]MDZ8285218.1 hypothetical protein [Nostoc sp. ChiSLP01]
MTDPSHASNGKDAAEMPGIREFQYEDNRWVETNPQTGDKDPIDKEDIVDDPDAKEDKSN